MSATAILVPTGAEAGAWARVELANSALSPRLRTMVDSMCLPGIEILAPCDFFRRQAFGFCREHPSLLNPDRAHVYGFLAGAVPPAGRAAVPPVVVLAG